MGHIYAISFERRSGERSPRAHPDINTVQRRREIHLQESGKRNNRQIAESVRN